MALAARLIQLNRGMWIDELKTWQVITSSYEWMMANRYIEGHLPFYFVFMRFWSALTGPTDWALRLPSVLLGVWSVFLVLRLGQDVCRLWVAWAGAGLMCFHALDLWASQTARMYALVSCMSVAAALQLLRLERGGAWRNAVGLAAATAVGLTAHALYAFVLIGQLAYLAWQFWAAGRLRAGGRLKCLVALALGCALAAPVWTRLARTQRDVANYERAADAAALAATSPAVSAAPSLADGEPVHVAVASKSGFEVLKRCPREAERMARRLMEVIFGNMGEFGYGRWFRALAATAGLAAIASLLWGLWRRGPLAEAAIAPIPSGAPEPPTDSAVEQAAALARYLVCWVGGFTLAMFLFSWLIEDKAGHARYYTPITGGICLGLAMAGAMIPRLQLAQGAAARNLLRLAFFALVAVATLMVSARWWRYPGDGLRQAIEHIEAQRNRNAERVIGCNDIATANGYNFYFPAYQGLGYAGVSRYEADPKKLEALLAGNSQPGRALWLLLYHEKDSPLAKVATSSPEFETVERLQFGEASVIQLRRRGEIQLPAPATRKPPAEPDKRGLWFLGMPLRPPEEVK